MPSLRSNILTDTSHKESDEKKISKEYGAIKPKSCVNLKREIGLLEAVAITIGSIIGSGIFVSPKGIVSNVGSVGASLVIWALCGFLSLVGSFCYAELGTTFPSAGGQYTYLYESFGSCTAFLYLYSNAIILSPINSAILALVVSEYIIQPFFPIGCTLPNEAVLLIAAASVGILTYVNCCDMQNINKFLNAFMVMKLAALSIIIVGGIYAICNGRTEHFKEPWADSKLDSGNIVLAIFSGTFAFGGWNSMASMMEELKEPNKNLPRAIFIALFTVTVVYLLANISYFAVLTPEEIISSDAVAVTFTNKIFGAIGWTIPIFVALSCFGGLSVNILTTSRHCLMGARERQLPVMLSFISVSNQIPLPAILFLGLLSMIYLFFADVFTLIAFSSITQGFFNLAIIVGLLYLRWKKPDIHRPYKVSLFFPISYLILLVLLFIIPFYEEPKKALMGTILIFSGLPIYYLFVVRESLSKLLQSFIEPITESAQKIFLIIKED